MATFFMHLSGAISFFISYLQFEKRYSQHTIIAYQNDLDQFFQFGQAQFELENIEDILPMHIRTWLANLKDQGITSRSINRKLSSLKSFFKFQLRQKNVLSSPLGTLTGPKSGKKLPSWIEASQIETLVNRDIYPEDWEGTTAHLAITILYEAGLRRSELVSLQESQIDFHSHTIRVLGKGHKERILPVRPQLLEQIRKYVAEKNSIFSGLAGGTLLIREKDSPINAQWVYRTVKRYAALITTQEKKSPHVLRHSFATHLTNAGADLNAVKELLGHSSLAATQVYTHNSIEKLKRVHGKSHPKG
jgi:integrase/recombinase XerC